MMLGFFMVVLLCPLMMAGMMVFGWLFWRRCGKGQAQIGMTRCVNGSHSEGAEERER